MFWVPCLGNDDVISGVVLVANHYLVRKSIGTDSYLCGMILVTLHSLCISVFLVACLVGPFFQEFLFMHIHVKAIC